MEWTLCGSNSKTELISKMKTYIYQHLGLGDHIICNGLIRELAKNYEDINLFVKHHNLESVQAMYSDLGNLSCIAVANDSQVIEFLALNCIKDVVKIGHEFLDHSKNFDCSFYEQMHIDLRKRWSSFFVKRNEEREKVLYSQLNPLNKQYVFVHDDSRFGIDFKRIESAGLEIIKPNLSLTKNIFDYLYTLEQAEMIHCIPSTFMFISDSIPLKAKLFLHMCARPCSGVDRPTLTKEWRVL